MIKLFQFPAFWHLPNLSPFCMKIETYLRLAQLPYEVITVRDPTKAPKGKLPYIVDDGVKIADSGLIVTYLQQKYPNQLDANLSPLQRAEAVAIQRLLEEHLYWIVLYSRWIDPSNWQIMRATVFARLPAYLRWFVPGMVQRRMHRDLYAQGIGRHSPEEIMALGIDDLTALQVMLTKHRFLVSDEPSSYDASGYAFLASILEAPFPSPLQSFMRDYPEFKRYCNEMRDRSAIPVK